MFPVQPAQLASEIDASGTMVVSTPPGIAHARKPGKRRSPVSDPLKYDCPFCQAPAGYLCRFIGNRRGRDYHQDREDLAKPKDEGEVK